MTVRRERAHRRRGPPPLPHATTPAAASSRPSCSRPWPASSREDLSAADGARSRCGAPPRCARRSSGCGRCSPRPSCCTTCSAPGRCCATPARGCSTDDEWPPLLRAPLGDRSTTWSGPTTTCRCSTRPGPCSAPKPRGAPPGRRRDDDEVRTYGHIVVDEAQDLSPMQLRMLEPPLAQRLDDRRRRHRPVHRRVGPRQLAGDPRPPARPPPAAPRRAHRRLPAAGAQHGAGRRGCWRVADPDSQPPRSIREDGDPPRIAAGRADEPGRRGGRQAHRRARGGRARATWPSSCPRRWSTR